MEKTDCQLLTREIEFSYRQFSISARAEVFPPAQKLEKATGIFEFYARLADSDKTSARAS